MWIFGYGSLIWKVDFPYELKIVGYVKGFERKFYQLSTDHRGTPENPGRVVTLIPNKQDFCVWGVAYKIKNEDIDMVVDHLDYRERGGYICRKVTFFPMTDQLPFEINIYVGTEDNHNYGGEADDNTIAFQICNSVGPSGTNVEYLFNLANTMREIAPHVNDEHLFNIEDKVLEILNKKL